MKLHKSTNIVDSSKLQEYLDCPRKYMFRHVLGWKLDQPAHALHFGTCWHSALEALWINGFGEFPDDVERVSMALQIAQATFLCEYREMFDEQTDEIYFPKSPAMAFEALEDYIRLMRPEAKEWQVLHSEISFTAPILNGYVMSGRMDQLCQNRGTGMYKAREYKTTGRFDRQWRDQWLLSTQIGCYTHVLYSLYAPNEVYGVVVEGAIFQKKGVQIQPIPCRKTPSQMLNWLTSTTIWYDHLQNDLNYLREKELSQIQNEDVLQVFPLNSQSCTKYFGCEFHDYCATWANPLQQDEPPIGYKIDYWDPNDRPSKANFNLEKSNG